MTIFSLPFIALAAVAAVVFHCLPPSAARRVWLALLNAAVLAVVVPGTQALVVLGLFVAATFVVIRLVSVWLRCRLSSLR